MAVRSIILLVEGKHDKIHLENAFAKLKDEYKNLDFDIFSLGGELKIRPFMTGLYETGLKNNVIYIAIYDNDPDGIKSLTNNQSGFDVEIENCGYRKLKEDQTKHNNFFAFALIKPDGFSSHCTIETMYDSEKYESAFTESVKRRVGNFSNHSIDDISKKIKDGSKTILAENVKKFEKEDFKYFRPLFNLILKIKKECSVNISAKKKNDVLQRTTKSAKINQTAQTANTIDDEIFYFKSGEAQSKGKYNDQDKSFTILKGSEIPKRIYPSYSIEEKRKRDLIITSSDRQERESTYIINEDVKFNSPSGASSFAKGGSSNGWNDWKNVNGKSLDDIYRKKNDN